MSVEPAAKTGGYPNLDQVQTTNRSLSRFTESRACINIYLRRRVYVSSLWIYGRKGSTMVDEVNDTLP